MDRDQLVKLFDRQIDVEERAIKAYGDALAMIGNFAFRLIFEGLLMDSKKHKRIFEVLKENIMLPPSEWDLAVSQKIGEYVSPIELERHIKLEEGMIELIKTNVKSVEDKTIRNLLEYVLQDEKRHHSVIKELIAQL